MFGFGEEAKKKKRLKQFSLKFENSLGVLDKKLSKPQSLFGKKRDVSQVGLGEYIDLISRGAGGVVGGMTYATLDNSSVINSGAKIIKTLMINYHDKIAAVQEKLELGNTDLLSCHIEDIKGIPKSIHEELRSVRYRIRAAFLVLAYYIEQSGSTDFESFIADNGLENVQEKRVRHLADGKLKLQTTFKSLGIALLLFKQFNQELLIDLQKAKAINDKKQQSHLLLQNAAFVYEVVDIVIEFIKGFELGGTDVIMTLHQDIMEELRRNKEGDEILGKKIDMHGELSPTASRVLKDIENRKLFRDKCEQKWQVFLGNIGQSQNRIDKYRERINDLELIRDNAKGQLGILQVLTSMQMINDNLQTLDQIMAVDDLELAFISESEFASLLNIDLSQSVH